jgi:hypothetical protein
MPQILAHPTKSASPILCFHQSVEDDRGVNGAQEARVFRSPLPFSNRLLHEAHATLMEGVRGEQKTPGEFRRSQNWIGDSNPGNARFVPPLADDVPKLMSDLERFAHNTDRHLPPLLKQPVLYLSDYLERNREDAFPLPIGGFQRSRNRSPISNELELPTTA